MITRSHSISIFRNPRISCSYLNVECAAAWGFFCFLAKNFDSLFAACAFELRTGFLQKVFLFRDAYVGTGLALMNADFRQVLLMNAVK